MKVVAAFVQSAIGWLVAIALFAMMAITFLDVVGRYLVNRPLPGAAELVQYMMITSIFIALPLVTLKNDHINISLIDSMLGERGRKLQRTLVWLISALVLGLLALRLWIHGAMLAVNRDVIGFLNLPVAPAAFFASVLSGITVLVLVGMIVAEWRVTDSERRPAPSGSGGKFE